MAWANEMKNLAAEIKTSHKDRTARVKGIKRETQHILGEADNYMKRVATELKEMARDLKDFLTKSEEVRKKDFNAMMGEIQALIKEIRGEVKNFLAKSEEKRITDFRALMRDIKGTIEAVKRAVGAIKKSTKDLLGDYKTERKEAARYWTSRGGKEVEVKVKEEAPEVAGAATKKRGEK